LVDSDRPTDMYYLLDINCKYKKRIHDLLQDLRLINQRRKDLEDKYSVLKGKLNYQPVPKAPAKFAFKVVKGDPIDELFF